MFLYCSNKGLGFQIDAHIYHLKTGALKHHAHQVFADVMHIAFDGSHYECAGRLDTGCYQQRT